MSNAVNSGDWFRPVGRDGPTLKIFSVAGCLLIGALMVAMYHVAIQAVLQGELLRAQREIDAKLNWRCSSVTAIHDHALCMQTERALLLPVDPLSHAKLASSFKQASLAEKP